MLVLYNLWLGYVQYLCYLTCNLVTELTEYICNAAFKTHIKVLLWNVIGASRGNGESTLQSVSVLNARPTDYEINPLKPELNPICYLLALLVHHFLHVSRIRVKSLTLRLLMSYIYGAPILDVSRSHTMHHSR